MKIVFSPSKTMKYKDIRFSTEEMINFPDKTRFLIEKLKKISKAEIEKIFKVKGNLLEDTYNNIQNFENLESFDALALYDGVTFRQLEIHNYSNKNFDYLNENLFIFSALYGVLSPNTKIKPYRLDMSINFLEEENLYKFWKEEVNSYLTKFNEEIFINLASKEFSKILDYKKFNIIDIEFRQLVDGKLKNISTEAKKARGLLLNYLVINEVDDLEKIKEFKEAGYKFSEENSSSNHFLFIK